MGILNKQILLLAMTVSSVHDVGKKYIMFWHLFVYFLFLSQIPKAYIIRDPYTFLPTADFCEVLSFKQAGLNLL